VSDPQAPGAITGYQPQTSEKIDVVNHSKELENQLGDWIAELRKGPVDQRWVAIAVTDFQKGFMALNRAVFQPESRL
jgi:hypothetical protein